MSRSPRFFTDSLPASGTAFLDEAESAHAARVLRLRTGDSVTLLDGKGGIAESEIIEAAPKSTLCKVLSLRHEAPTTPAIIVYSALPKGCAEDMVDQLAQLGCDRFVPLTCTRSVVEAKDNKMDRFRRTAKEASKQAIRAWVMEVGEPVAFKNALAAAKGLRLIADPRGGPVDARTAGAGEISVLIGPEGGFTDEELQQAQAAGFVLWKFAPFVLRIETAAVGAVAVLRADLP